MAPITGSLSCLLFILLRSHPLTIFQDPEASRVSGSGSVRTPRLLSDARGLFCDLWLDWLFELVINSEAKDHKYLDIWMDSSYHCFTASKSMCDAIKTGTHVIFLCWAVDLNSSASAGSTLSLVWCEVTAILTALVPGAPLPWSG